MDEPVAQGGHLAGLADLVGVVLGAEGVVALPVGVDAVHEVVVVVPEVVLLADGGIDEIRAGLGLTALLAEGGVGEKDGELGVAGVGGGEAIDREGAPLAGPAAGGFKEVHEAQAVARGDAAHGLGVERKTRVLAGAVGEVTLGGKVLEGDG